MAFPIRIGLRRPLAEIKNMDEQDFDLLWKDIQHWALQLWNQVCPWLGIQWLAFYLYAKAHPSSVLLISGLILILDCFVLKHIVSSESKWGSLFLLILLFVVGFGGMILVARVT
jgi:hypothetical protein